MPSTASSSRSKIMSRAWELFRERYAYPKVPFRSIGRPCFTSCLKAAWHEAREVARLAARPIEILRASLDALQTPSNRVGLSTSYREDGAARADRLWQVRIFNAAIAQASLTA